jgi:hypothetical protein
MEAQQSVTISCNTRALLGFQHTKFNDAMLMQRFMSTAPTQIREVDEELKLQKEIYRAKEYLCTPMIQARGGNALACTDDSMLKQGYQNYSPYHMSEFLLIPCKQNTYRNYVDCDEDKCCSIQHQMFNNMTKRK